jgi:hypothetical protein
VSNEQPRRQRDQPPATFNDGFRRINFGVHREFVFYLTRMMAFGFYECQFYASLSKLF